MNKCKTPIEYELRLTLNVKSNVFNIGDVVEVTCLDGETYRGRITGIYRTLLFNIESDSNPYIGIDSSNKYESHVDRVYLNEVTSIVSIPETY